MKIHFRGLNSLRFYAALSVVVAHIQTTPHEWFGDELLPDTFKYFFLSSGVAVDLFFLLSGFLIFYLLLDEHKNTGRVSVARFYWRRSLRIWPLYWLIIFLAAVYLPALSPEFVNALAGRPGLAGLLIFFAGNVAFVLYTPFPPLEHLWSISIEEQFYLIAPHLVRRRLPLVLLAVLVAWLLIKFVWPWPAALKDFLELMDYEYILVGGLWACMVFYRWPVLAWVRSLAGRWLALAAFLLIVVGVGVGGLVGTLLYSLIFGMLVVNIIDDAYGRLSRLPALECAGVLTYGLYMYHPILLLVYRVAFYGRIHPDVYGFMIYPIVISLSFLLAWLSYVAFESPWLKLKNLSLSKVLAYGVG